MLQAVAVFFGGGLGAVLRFLCCKLIATHFGTLFVNEAGAFFIGALYQYITQRGGINTTLKLFLMTGLLGGFTTFSTYLLDTVKLMQQQSVLEAVFYLCLSIILGVVCLLLGMKIIELIG